MTGAKELFKIFVPLAALAYLGFYVYGLILSVFSPGELPLFTAIAVVCVVVVAAVLLARRRGIDAVAPDSPRARAARSAKETRGF